jgi:methylmalonyl-CoA/ethylmalonyl-CoA epimerase
VKKLHHVAIAVRDLGKAFDFYRDVLGFEPAGEESVPEQKVRVAFFKGGDTLIELVAPSAADAPIAKFLEIRGPGLHHICIEVDDIEAEMARLRGTGAAFIDDKPRPGAHGGRIAFMRPASSGGVLIELRQK